MNNLIEHGNSDVSKALVGAKLDLSENRQVSREQGMEFANKHNLLVYSFI